MKINCKLLQMAVIITCLIPNVFAVQNDTIGMKSNGNNTKVLPQQEHKYNKIKTSITNSIPKYNIDTDTNTRNQLCARFMEKTGFNNIKEIDGQSIDSIKQEIEKLDDSKLNVDNLKDYSQGLLKFIATGSLSYGTISPDDALAQYNSIVDTKLKLESQIVNDERQKDIDEINAREDLQDLAKEYEEIVQRNSANINQSTGEVIQQLSKILNESSNNTIQRTLINAYLSVDNNEIININPPTKEEIAELKKEIQERIDLPGSKRSIGVKLKRLVGNIKKLFNKSKENEYSNNEQSNTIQEQINETPIQKIQLSDNEQSNSDSILSNTLTKDEAVELMMENSALLN